MTVANMRCVYLPALSHIDSLVGKSYHLSARLLMQLTFSSKQDGLASFLGPDSMLVQYLAKRTVYGGPGYKAPSASFARLGISGSSWPVQGCEHALASSAACTRAAKSVLCRQWSRVLSRMILDLILLTDAICCVRLSPTAPALLLQQWCTYVLSH